MFSWIYCFVVMLFLSNFSEFYYQQITFILADS